MASCGRCEGCRKKYFGRNSQVSFQLSEFYLYTVVLSENDENQPCECKICEKVRGKRLNNIVKNEPSNAGLPKLAEDSEGIKITVMRKSAKDFNISGWLFFSLVAKSKVPIHTSYLPH